MRSPCLACGSRDRILCSRTCDRLRRYQAIIDVEDAGLDPRVQHERCRALLAAVFHGRSKGGRMDVELFHEKYRASLEHARLARERCTLSVP